MANKPSVRVVLNRSAMSKIELAVADGVYAVGLAMLAAADPPDATPYGVGLVRNGGVLGFIGRKKIAGFGLDGRQPTKPRAVRLIDRRTQVVVGFGFPGRFQELGTIRQPARPFLAPVVEQVAPSAPSIMARVVGPRLRRI